MGIKERRERERRERRAAILQTTRAIAAESGWQAVTIRRIADSLELSNPTIYEHFASKDAILAELLRHGYRDCLSALRRARASSDDPRVAIVRMGQAYWDEARASPELYQVIYGLGGVPFSSQSPPPEASETHEEIRQAILAVLARSDSGASGGRLDRGSAGGLDDLAEERAHLVWAVLHGLVALDLAGFSPSGRDSAALIEAAVTAVVSAGPDRRPGG